MPLNRREALPGAVALSSMPLAQASETAEAQAGPPLRITGFKGKGIALAMRLVEPGWKGVRI